MNLKTFKDMVDVGMAHKGFAPDQESQACATVHGEFVGKYINNEKPSSYPAFVTASARELRVNDAVERAISLVEHRIKNAVITWQNNLKADNG